MKTNGKAAIAKNNHTMLHSAISQPPSQVKYAKVKIQIRQTANTVLKWNFLLLLSVTGMVFSTGSTNAQAIEDSLLRKNHFRIEAGATYLKTMDFQYSPRMFESLRYNVHLGYSNIWKKGTFFVNLNAFMGNLSPASGPDLDFYIRETDIYGNETAELNQLQLSQMGFNLEIGYIHEIKKWATAKTSVYLGGSLEESLTFTPGFLNIGIINYASLNGIVQLNYMLGNDKPLAFCLSLPFVSLVTRMPYHNSPNFPGKSGLEGFFINNNHVETLNHFQNFRFSVHYPLLVRKKTALNIGYEASWMHYYRPEHLTQTGSQLSLGFNF